MEFIIALNSALIICILIGVITKKISDAIYRNGIESLCIGPIEINKFWFCLVMFYVQTQALGALFIYLSQV